MATNAHILKEHLSTNHSHYNTNKRPSHHYKVESFFGAITHLSINVFTKYGTCVICLSCHISFLLSGLLYVT